MEFILCCTYLRFITVVEGEGGHRSGKISRFGSKHRMKGSQKRKNVERVRDVGRVERGVIVFNKGVPLGRIYDRALVSAIIDKKKHVRVMGEGGGCARTTGNYGDLRL